jgi:transposase
MHPNGRPPHVVSAEPCPEVVIEDDALPPDSVAKARRRVLTAAFKLKILSEYDALPRSERGAYLRRNGLYRSHIDKWKSAIRAGRLGSHAPEYDASKSSKPQSWAEMRHELEQTNKKLEAAEQQLRQAHKILDLQKKILSLCAEKPRKRREP